MIRGVYHSLDIPSGIKLPTLLILCQRSARGTETPMAFMQRSSNPFASPKIPITLATNNEVSEYQEEDRLYFFEINSKEDSALGSIDAVGHISIARDLWQNSRNRAVIHGDTVYYINNTSVWSTDWMSPSEQNGPM